MSHPIAICIELVNAEKPTERYVSCVALSGAEPGLGVAADGTLLWRSCAAAAFHLWVSADGQLILLRPEAATAVLVVRAERVLEVPSEKPVVLLDQDEVAVGLRRFRIHVHGRAPHVYPPTPLRERSLTDVAKVAAVVALGAAAAGCPDKIEVRDQPPQVPVREVPSAHPTTGSGALDPKDGSTGDAATSVATNDASAAASATTTAATGATSSATAPSKATASKPPPIEVRPRPPAVPPPATLKPPPKPPKKPR